MKVTFWGTRGSLATPGPTTVRYGGNTSCVEVRADDGTLLIFDCGTGARRLGLSLLEASPEGVEGSILLGHSHWDHIQGFPFFMPVFTPGSQFTIYAPSGGDRRLADVLAGQMEYTYFPVSLDQLESQITFRDLGEESFAIGPASVRTQYLNHTAVTLAYRVTLGGATIVYATDHEPNAPMLWRIEPHSGQRSIVHPGDRRHVEFLAGADVVIHDAQYTAEEYPAKVGWGHSSMEYCVEVAAEAGVKKLVLFHHDPSRTDDQLDELLDTCHRQVETKGVELEIYAAAEDWSIVLDEVEGAARATRQATTRGRRPRVLIAEDDPDVRGLLSATLAKDNYELMVARDGQEALALALGRVPDLVLLDLRMPVMDGREVLRALRAEPRTKHVPIVFLTASASEDDIVKGFEGGATDYMTKPFAPAMVRTRVKSWLLRREGGQRS